MNTIKEEILRNYTKKNNLIFYFTFNRDGDIGEYNTFASEFIKKGEPILNIREVFVDFFNRINFEELAKTPEKEHMFSINSFNGIPESLYFTFHKVGEEFITLGRLDVMEMEAFHTKIIALNNELSNISRDLHKSNAELKKMNELKNHFLGMAMHDIRKPISIIKGYTKMLLNGAAENKPGMTEEFLRMIDSATLNMETLVNDFLDVSVIESGKLELVVSDFDMKESLSEMLFLNRMKAQNRKITLVTQTGEKPLLVSADKAKVQQVIDNMTANALDYTPNGGKVTVTLEDNGDFIKFSVEDEGPGIPDEKMKNLFKAFGKSGAIKVSAEKSTGLGLLISRKIVEEHGGAIGAGNRADKGAVFWFKIPKKNSGRVQ